eukprot:13685034-Heterocapsa_arctica.AAC.1
MLKAKQIQMHKRDKTVKTRQGSGVADKSGTEYNSEVTKNIKIFQNSINETQKGRSRQIAYNEQEQNG